jgi:hypothetical protein
MPRSFFDTHDGDHLVTDDEGLELDGLASVQAETLAALADIARGAVPKAHREAMIVSVRDEAGQVVFRATLSLKIEGQFQ